MSEAAVQELSKSPEAIMRQTLSPQVIEALRNEANGKPAVSFLIIDKPQETGNPYVSEFEGVFGPMGSGVLGKLRVAGLSDKSNRVRIQVTGLSEEPKVLFGVSYDKETGEAKVTGDQPLVYVQALAILLQSSDGKKLLRPDTGYQLGPSQNPPLPVVPSQIV